MEKINIILIIIGILVAIIAVQLTKKYTGKSSFNIFLQEGDLNPDLQAIYEMTNALERVDALSGDVDFDNDLEALAPLSSISGDIDDIIDDTYDDDLLQGGPLSKLKNKLKGNKPGKGKFPANLIANQSKSNVLKTATDAKDAVLKLNQVNAISQMPGALIAGARIPRVQVIGGSIKQRWTDAKYAGDNFASGIENWELDYPGLTRAKSLTSTGADLTFSFVEPGSDEVSRVIPIIIVFVSSTLNAAPAEVGVTVDGEDLADVQMMFTRDRVALFSDKGLMKTTMILFPAKKLKEELFINQFKSPTTAKPLVITLAGVPTGVSATVKLAGMDDEEWLDYKKMMGLSNVSKS